MGVIIATTVIVSKVSVVFTGRGKQSEVIYFLSRKARLCSISAGWRRQSRGGNSGKLQNITQIQKLFPSALNHPALFLIFWKPFTLIRSNEWLLCTSYHFSFCFDLGSPYIVGSQTQDSSLSTSWELGRQTLLTMPCFKFPMDFPH